jgi:signal transduction histidine kinase
MSGRGAARAVVARTRTRSRRETRNAWPGGPFLISARPPGPTQEWIARALAALLFTAFLVAVWFRDVQLSRQDTYVPITNTIVCLNDVITAALLYAQFAVTRSRALIVLASGFLFKALVLIPHGLTFPGADLTGPLLGARMQVTIWLYLSQHVVFVLGAIVYTALRDREGRANTEEGPIGIPIAAAASIVATAVLLLTWGLMANASRLPPIMADALHTTATFRRVVAPALILLGTASVFVFQRRPTSMIDLWLQVAIWSWLFETLLTATVQERFSLVYYVSRTMGVVSSSFVLIVFLSESLMLHRRLVLAMAARELEREGHRSAIDVVVGTLAHELRQPLASILVNEKAGTQLLSARPAAPGELCEVFEDIRASVLRANEIIDSVRTMFDAASRDRAPVDANELVRQAVELMHIDLEASRIAVEVDVAPMLPPIQAHRGQLLEVLLNGLKNAIESLTAITHHTRHLRIRTHLVEADGVAISIEDSGLGLDPRIQDRVFEPYCSTKPRGMGLGLSICEAIVSAHGGTISLSPGSARGAVFRVDLPTRAADLSPRQLRLQLRATNGTRRVSTFVS